MRGIAGIAFSFMAVLGLTTSNAFASDPNVIFDSPFVTAQGNPLQSAVVRIEPDGEDPGTIHLHPIEQPSRARREMEKERRNKRSGDRDDIGTPMKGFAQPTKAMLTWSVNVNSPQVVSASVGVIVGEGGCSSRKNEISWFCGGRGLLLALEPGINGGKVVVGYALFAAGAGMKHFLAAPVAGFALKAALMQTWGEKILIAPGQTYAGVELTADILLRISGGVMRRVAGEGGVSDVWLFTYGLGFGF